VLSCCGASPSSTVLFCCVIHCVADSFIDSDLFDFQFRSRVSQGTWVAVTRHQVRVSKFRQVKVSPSCGCVSLLSSTAVSKTGGLLLCVFHCIVSPQAFVHFSDSLGFRSFVLSLLSFTAAFCIELKPISLRSCLAPQWLQAAKTATSVHLICTVQFTF